MIGNLVNWGTVAAWIVAGLVAVRFHFITSASSDGAASPVVPVLALVGAAACGVMAIRATRDAIRGEPKVDKPVRYKPKPRPPAAPYTEEDRQFAESIVAALIESGAVIEGEVTADAIIARLEREQEEPPLDTYMFLRGFAMLEIEPLRHLTFVPANGEMDHRLIAEIVSDVLRVCGRDVPPNAIAVYQPDLNKQPMQVSFDLDGSRQVLDLIYHSKYHPEGLYEGFARLARELGWPPLAISFIDSDFIVAAVSDDALPRLNAKLPDERLHFELNYAEDNPTAEEMLTAIRANQQEKDE